MTTIATEFNVAGGAKVQVSEPRQPCWKLARRWGLKDLPFRVVQTERSGWYLLDFFVFVPFVSLWFVHLRPGHPSRSTRYPGAVCEFRSKTRGKFERNTRIDLARDRP